MDIISSDFRRVSKDQIRQASAYAASILSDVTGRRAAMSGRVKPLSPTMRVCGTAFTVEVRPGDNLMIHAALCLARPGDVLVVDGKASLDYALMGELMCTHARAAGVAGIVIDGAVRDVDTLMRNIVPVFACGVSPNGPTKRLAGRIGQPVSVGNVSVGSGDLIVGDHDGVVVVPQGDLSWVLEAARAKVEAERRRLTDISEGRLVYSWLEGALQEVKALRDGETLDALIQRFAEDH